MLESKIEVKWILVTKYIYLSRHKVSLGSFQWFVTYVCVLRKWYFLEIGESFHLAFFTYPNTGVLEVGFMECNFLRYGHHFPVVLCYEVSVHSILTVLCVRNRFLELLAGLLFQKSEYPCFVWCKLCFCTRIVVCLGVLPRWKLTCGGVLRRFVGTVALTSYHILWL